MVLVNSQERASGALEHDGLEHVGYVFRFVAGFLEDFQEFFQLDQRDGVEFTVEQAPDGFAADFVRLVLQAIDLDAVVQKMGVVLVEQGDGLSQFLGLSEDDVGKYLGRRRGLGDLVGQQPIAGGEDEVEDVIERRGKKVNVLAIKRGDERLVELDQDAVRHLIAAMLDGSNPGNSGRHLLVVVVVKQVRQRPGPFDNIVCDVGKQFKKLSFTRYEANHEKISYREQTWATPKTRGGHMKRMLQNDERTTMACHMRRGQTASHGGTDCCPWDLPGHARDCLTSPTQFRAHGLVHRSEERH